MEARSSMKKRLVFWVTFLSFFCILDVMFPEALKHNLSLGCEQFAVWENAHGDARYWFLHCPDEVMGKVETHGVWVDR